MSGNSTSPTRVALVTGASSGIGWATARSFAAAGLRVVLVARREERLRTLAEEIARAGGESHVLVADLAREADRRRVIDEARERFGRVDVLVNNAGFGWAGQTWVMPWPIAKRMLDVNVEAVVHLTRLVLPEMVARGSGHVINLSSVAGAVVLPPEVLYSTTRAFVQAFSDGLYRELRGTGVHVSVVNPGPVKTEFARVAQGVPVDQRPDLEHGVSAESVARAIADLLRRPRKIVWVPFFFAVVPAGALVLGFGLDLFARRLADKHHAVVTSASAFVRVFSR
jgi:short-subunit dehydrogenase